MDRSQGLQVVEGLRAAAKAGGPVTELAGDDARKFHWMDADLRRQLLGGFSIDAGSRFYVVVASTPRSDEDFQFMVFERLGGSQILTTRSADSRGVIWTYQAAKQSGDNRIRKEAFQRAAGSDALTIPYPDTDVSEFSQAVIRAIELRDLADAAGIATQASSATWRPPDAVLPPHKKLPPSRVTNTTVPGVVWRLCTGGGSATLTQINDAIAELPHGDGHTAEGMLSGYARRHGCMVTSHGIGAEARYTIVPPDEIAEATGSGAAPFAADPPDNGSSFAEILDALREKSLSFSAELVATYLLALQAKGFVLLTGISGTGKTRLAQEVARALAPRVEPVPTLESDAFEIVAKPSQLKYARFIVPSELAQEFDALTNPEIKRVDLKVPGLPLASMAFHKAPERGNLMYVLLSGATKAWFTANIKLGGRFLLSKKMTGDKEWLDLALPTESRPQVALPTYELIAVRPDWTDARAVLGFYNPLTKSYLATPTLRLLLRAHAEVQAATDGPPRPFFLIFDEMNLARVEHYFSDFLSAMESGEAIHLHDDPQVEEEEDVPRRITIPKNVFVIGTVNVDETTYMFSPKVLDRAFVLEFNDVDLGGLAGPVQSEASESTPLSLVNLEGGLKLRGQGSGEWNRFEMFLGGEARALFGRIHDALAVENRHFGYRVAREVARFVDLAVEQAGTSDATVRAALDVAVLAKILPKLHGSQAEIEATLSRLLSLATGNRPEGEVFTPHGALIDGAALPLPRTARKLGRMLYRLRANGFVSFIE